MTPTLQLLAMHEADIRLQNLQCRMLLWEGKIDPVEYPNHNHNHYPSLN